MDQQAGTPAPRVWALRRRLRRIVARLRHLIRGLSPLRRTVFCWVRTGPGGEFALGRRALALEHQPSDRVTVGNGVVVGDHVDVRLGPAGRLEIGDGTVLCNHVHIAADELVRIGPGCRIGPYSVLTDTWTYGRHPDGVAPAPPPDPVVIGAAAVLGTRTVVGPGGQVADGQHVEIGTMVSGHGPVDAASGRAS